MTEHYGNQKQVFERIQSGLAALGIDIVLIGSVGAGKTSTHDLDILVLRPASTLKTRRQILTFFRPFVTCDITDWRGYFIGGTRFGTIEVFFLDMLLKSAANPGPLRLMRVILRCVNSFASISLRGPLPENQPTEKCESVN